jgi:hypothetical protein
MTAAGPPIGRLNGIYAEQGTILGPDLAGQWFAVADNDPDGVTVRYATTDDMELAMARPPQSVAEVALRTKRPVTR